jgi:hypothetical protein
LQTNVAIANVLTFFKNSLLGIFFVLYTTLLHLPPSDFTVPTDAGIELAAVGVRIAADIFALLAYTLLPTS